MAGERRVEPARALGERGEAVVPAAKPTPGADGGDVVEVAPHALELEQDRPCAGERLGRVQARAPPRRRARRRRRSRRRRPRRRARRSAQPLGERRALGGAFETAVLVEEPRVERGGCGRRRRGSGSGRTRSRRRGSARRRPGTRRGRARGRSTVRAARSWSSERAQRLVARRSRRRRGRAPRARPSRPPGARSTIEGTLPAATGTVSSRVAPSGAASERPHERSLGARGGRAKRQPAASASAIASR